MKSLALILNVFFNPVIVPIFLPRPFSARLRPAGDYPPACRPYGLEAAPEGKTYGPASCSQRLQLGERAVPWGTESGFFGVDRGQSGQRPMHKPEYGSKKIMCQDADTLGSIARRLKPFTIMAFFVMRVSRAHCSEIFQNRRGFGERRHI